MTRSSMTTPGVSAPPAPTDWTSCPACGWLLYRRRLERDLHVCPECDAHLRLGARARIDQLVDPGSFAETVFPERDGDPLGFTDLRAYPDRLRDAAHRSGESEAVVVGVATIGGTPVVLAVMDFGFLGGSMGVEVGRRVSGAAALALERGLPLLAVCASGGARMQEGVFSLFQMARVSEAFGRLREAGLFSVCVLTDPTYGGVSASFATLASVLVGERGAHVGFAGPRVVQETIRAELPSDFQTAEFLLAHGLVDRVESRAELRPLLVRLLALHAPDRPRGEVDEEPDPTTPDVTPPPDSDPWDVVQRARVVDRPTTLDYLHTAFDDFVELHGDRAFGDDPALIGGVASIGGHSVVVLGHEKGHSVRERVAHEFGMPHPEGYRKAMRLLGHAEVHGLPVVTLVDTPGAHPGPEAEEHGQSHAIAEIIMHSSRLRVPVVSVVTGEGGSGGALALCTSDRLLVLENAYLSVISPEGCAAILWRTATAAPTAARAMRLGAAHLYRSGIATSVVAEPPGGAHTDPAGAARLLRAAVRRELDELAGQDVDALLAARSRRFSRIDVDDGRPVRALQPVLPVER
ncbi:acetyl-CoA carboxylase carboxyltransferase subunit alpha/beta [Modestobacter sp. VKM Ac-2977]|uniref:acetyl-CoA carboxylase carboxyltransferase subunit alpha/beta n=1 Tax=Modestobacter sp. VKM Ac-2977 TaxID=3004131 RepID=UPI0022AA27A5|nr:acetyl-CoA carboxylase carboxyltransferase subunit alpha/beta [Modestobacter sp. VKM Ac-2977]MCZ2821273.1 acetyl-CoA carboxylase carboxyltransferase subunit alpha/beta [Modestobacter sp. VKM Ac-2977]